MSNQGITLVELLVVMVILSMALAIVVPSMTNSYENWVLRSAGRRTVALFRLASDVARRDGSQMAAYYKNSRIVLLRNATVYKELEIPPSITVHPEQPAGAVFLPSGQIVVSEPFVFENSRGRKMIVQVGPLLGQVNATEATK